MSHAITPSPWATPTLPVDPAPATPVRAIPTWGRIGGIPAAALDLDLSLELSEPYGGIVAVGAHGGAGTSTLASITGMKDGGHTWPVTDPATPNAVLIVARTNMDGLNAARRAAMKAFSGQIPGVDVLGAVFMADLPQRRLPRVLDDHLQLVAGAFPAYWRIEWIEGLRTGEPTKLSAHSARVVQELQALDAERKTL